jgi:hypothetical protein
MATVNDVKDKTELKLFHKKLDNHKAKFISLFDITASNSCATDMMSL